MINYDAMFIISEDIVISEINNESVILNLNTGIYFQTNELGSFIVSLLNEFHSLRTIEEKIAQSFDVTRDKCRNDILKFIENLNEKKLLSFK